MVAGRPAYSLHELTLRKEGDLYNEPERGKPDPHYKPTRRRVESGMVTEVNEDGENAGEFQVRCG